MVAKNGIKIRVEYTDTWEEKLAEALYNLHLRLKDKKEGES